MALKIGGAVEIASGDKIENGVWIHIEGPDRKTGENVPLYQDKEKTQPVRARVRSHRCSLIKAAEQKLTKDGIVRYRKAKKKERDGVIADTSILDPAERFSLLLAAVDNFHPQFLGVQEVSEADAINVIYKDPQFDYMVDQVTEAAYDDTLYMTAEEIAVVKAKEAAKEGDDPQPKTAEAEA